MKSSTAGKAKVIVKVIEGKAIEVQLNLGIIELIELEVLSTIQAKRV